MLVGIDQRRECRRTFDRRIEPDTQLAQIANVGPKAGRNNQFIRNDVPAAGCGSSADRPAW
jgi:hypothetical protein